MSKLKRKIYSPWAYTENEMEKYKINRSIYKEIKDKAELSFVKVGYGHKVYEVVNNCFGLSSDELALIADKGNLCFGYRQEWNKIIIYTD